MKNLFMVIFVGFFCIGCMTCYSVGNPMDGTEYMFNWVGQNRSFAVEAQPRSTQYARRFSCYVSTYNPGRTETLQYTTHEWDAKLANFKTGTGLIYITHDHPSAALILATGLFLGDPKNASINIKYLDGPGEVFYTCIHNN